MKALSNLAGLMIPLCAGLIPATSPGAQEGVALAIVYDTSGSMREFVSDGAGGSKPKYLIANKALLKVSEQLAAAATNQTKALKLDTCLFIFQNGSPREVIKLGPHEAGLFNRWATHFSSPQGNTPLGNAVAEAAKKVLSSPLTRKHVLVITDGLNTVGPPPQSVIPGLKQQAEKAHTSLSIHFVAFDVDAAQFASVKRQGATVVGAANEVELNSRLNSILQKQILLEDEEPATTHKP